MLEGERKLVEILLECELDERSRKFLTELLQKDDRWKITPSFKQRAWIKDLEARHIEGREVNNRGGELPTQYDNLKLFLTGDGYKISICDSEIDKPTTKKEGALILAWLNGCLDQIRGALEEFVKPEEEESASGDDEDLPF